MKVRPACAAVFSISTSVLLLAGIRCTQAAEIKIVSPSEYEDLEGAGIFGGVSEPPYRFQQVFPAEDFAALGNQPHWIVGYGPRADQSVASPRTAYLPDNEVRLSTTPWGRDDQSLVFDDNFGSDVMQFYRGPLTMVADVAGPGPGPKGFYHPDFAAGVTPFLYDPTQGNLLFDFIAWQGESPKILADQIPDMTVVAGDPLDRQGGRVAAAIFQFTFVPVGEPLPGDYNGDGILTATDIDLLSMEVIAGTNNVAFDANADRLVNQTDRSVWVNDLKKTYFGDSNLDGEFNSGDFVAVFQIGEYEDANSRNSAWADGDWNGDQDFTSSDFVIAFQEGGYEKGPRAGVVAVPEPNTLGMLMLGLFGFVRIRSRSVR